MDVIGIVLSLFALMFLAYRGYSVILCAPILALLAAVSQGLSPMPAYSELFMTKAVVYIKAFFPVFLLGAVFGKVMEQTGLAQAIAEKILSLVGKERSMLAVILASSVLTYGGVSLFVVVFIIYPFAAAMFKVTGVPKRLIPAAIVLGGCTYTMDALPGTPQLSNIIPTNFYGTTVFAAPILGIIGGLIIFFGGYAWMEYRRKAANNRGEFYGENHQNEPTSVTSGAAIDWRIAFIPLIAVLGLNLYLSYWFHWNPNMLDPFKAMGLPLLSPAVKNVSAIWSLTISVSVGIILAIIMGWRNLRGGNLAIALNAGAIGSLLALMNVASEVGYGNVIASLPGFAHISKALLSIQIGSTPLFSEAITVTTLAGITGSSSGGLSIALSLMAQEWLTWANSIGLSPAVLHRVAAMASGGLDSLPHSGATITIMSVCGLTHRQSYPDIAALVVIKTSAVFVVIGIFLATGWV